MSLGCPTLPWGREFVEGDRRVWGFGFGGLGFRGVDFRNSGLGFGL